MLSNSRRKRRPQMKEIPTSITNACPHCGNRNNGKLEAKIITDDGPITVYICTVCKTQYKKLSDRKPRPLRELETSNACYDDLPPIKKGDFTMWCPNCEEVPLMTDLTSVKFKDDLRQVYRCHNCGVFYRTE